MKLVEKTMAPLAKVIIQVSHNEKSQAISARITCNDKLQVIHNGMPYLDFSKRDGTNFNCLKMIMVARFEEQKDHKTLFRALVQLKDYNWSIDFVGDGPLIDWAKLFARDKWATGKM